MYLILVLFVFIGCSVDDQMSAKKQELEILKNRVGSEEQKVNVLKSKINGLQTQHTILKLEIDDLEAYYNANRINYLLKLEVKQKHYLNVSKMIKDQINAAEIWIPVNMKYYSKMDIGDAVLDKMRTGSLILEGSIGKWSIKVIDKKTSIEKIN